VSLQSCGLSRRKRNRTWGAPGDEDIMRIVIVHEFYLTSVFISLKIISDLFRLFVFASLPLLWPGGQSSWLQIQRSGFDFRRYQIF
jgi:hypothetical protein